MSLLLLFFSQALSQAAVPDCESAAALRSRAKSCEDNAVYSTAAKLCLERYDRAVAGAQKELAEKLLALTGAEKQSGGLENARGGYAAAARRLDGLVAEGRRLKRQVEAYRQELVWPEDFGSATAAGLDAKTFLGEQSCYSSTQKLLDSYAELLGLHARQLQLSAKASSGLSARSQRGAEDLAGGAPPPAAAAGKGSGSGKRARPSRNGPSDVTGTEQEKKRSGN